MLFCERPAPEGHLTRCLPSGKARLEAGLPAKALAQAGMAWVVWKQNNHPS